MDTPELFSVKSSFPAETIRKYQKQVLKLTGDTANSILEQKLEQLKLTLLSCTSQDEN